MTSRLDALSLTTARAPWIVRVAAYAMFLLELTRSAFNPESNLDNRLVVRAAANLFDGVSPYVEKRFLYPPSSIPFALLQTPFSDLTLLRVAPYVIGAMLLVGWWAALRVFDVRLHSWLGVVPIAFAAYFVPTTTIALLGSWTAPVAAAMGLALLLMSRDRWLEAGMVVGLSIAIKPMLMPLGLVFLLARRWRGFVAAAGLPVLICGVVLVLIPDPGLFFTKTLPFLLHGQDSYSQPYDSSLPVILPRLGLPDRLISLIRAAVFVLTLAGAVLRWRAGGDQRLRLVETSVLLMVGTFLISTPAFPHYATIVVPLLLASLVVPMSAARTLWFFLSLMPLYVFVQIPLIDYHQPGEYRQAFKPFMWLVLTLVVLLYGAWSSWRRRTPRETDQSRSEIDRVEARPGQLEAKPGQQLVAKQV